MFAFRRNNLPSFICYYIHSSFPPSSPGVEHEELEDVLADPDDHVDVDAGEGQLAQQQREVEPGHEQRHGGDVCRGSLLN